MQRNSKIKKICNFSYQETEKIRIEVKSAIMRHAKVSRY